MRVCEHVDACVRARGCVCASTWMPVCEHVDACAWSRVFCITVNLGIAGAIT